MNVGRFIAGVGALASSATSGAYLLLRRSDEKDYAAGVWECVTGRVNQGEGFEDAVRRELLEEIGVAARLDFIIGTTHFYRGEALPQNELLGVVYACTIEDPGKIRLSAEHTQCRWVTADSAEQLLTATDPSTQWTKRVIRRAEQLRGALPAIWSASVLGSGFELG